MHVEGAGASSTHIRPAATRRQSLEESAFESEREWRAQVLAGRHPEAVLGGSACRCEGESSPCLDDRWTRTPAEYRVLGKSRVIVKGN